MKRKLSMILSIMFVSTSLASCQSTQNVTEECVNSSDFTTSVIINDLMYNDMQELTVMPQEFLDYCENNGFEIEIEERLSPEGDSLMLYIITKDDLELLIGAILDLTNDSVEILYHNSRNAESLKANRSVEIGQFSGGYMLLGEIISITKDLEGNIQNIDLSNQDSNQLYVDRTLELYEFYQHNN